MIKDKKQTSNFTLIKKVLKYAAKFKSLYVGCIVLGLFITLISTLRPYLSMLAIDDYILKGNMEGLLTLCAIMGALILIEGASQYYFIYMADTLAFNVVYTLRTKLFKKISKFSHVYFDKNPVGVLVTRLVSDLETVSEMIGQGLFMIVGDSLKILLIVGVMFYTDVMLTVLVLMVLPLMYIATRYFQKSMKIAFQNVRKAVSALNVFVQERLNGINIIQSFTREKEELEIFDKVNQKHRDAHLKTVWHFSIFLPLVELFTSLVLSIIIYYTGIVKLGDVSAGVFVAFISYTQMLFRPIRFIADKINQIQHGIVASNRVLHLLEEEKSKIEYKGTIVKKVFFGNINFENVEFFYNEDEKVLHNISLNIKEGEKIGIVGETGSGKTSMLSLLMQNYLPQKGSIKIDGIEIQDYDINFYKEHIAYAQQDVFLFSDTLKENITLNNPNITEEDIWLAIDEMGIRHFVEKLPEQLNFKIGEKGRNLSSGESQLIAFLRIYLRKPSILLLDEATSNIDPITETLIQKSIVPLTKQRTSIIIAHRLSTLSLCDKILLLHRGKIEAYDTQENLLKNNKKFIALKNAQFKAV